MPKTKLNDLTEPMYYTLIALQKERCGIEITDFVMHITKQRVKLGPGTLYAMLSKFLEEGLIDEVRCEGRKRYYQSTAKGEQLLQEEYRRLKVMLQDGEPYLETLEEGSTSHEN